MLCLLIFAVLLREVQTYLFWSFVIIDASSIKEKAEGGHGHTLSLTVALLKFPHLCAHLDTKVDFIAILTHHFQLDVF